VGDLATDPQGPDAIAQGEPTVLINGRPAARLTDKTASGGVIVQGSPNVIIGMDFSGHCMHEAAQNGTALVRGVST
jgi:hypothetical protein